MAPQPEALSYRTRLNPTDYRFEFAWINGSIRIYILSQPDYGRRNASAFATHRLFCTATQRNYICWTDPILSFNEALTIAASWAENHQAYIATGTFGSQMHLDWNEDGEAMRRRLAFMLGMAMPS